MAPSVISDDPGVVWGVGHDLLVCARKAIETAGGHPKRAALWPNGPDFVDCCDGQLYVTWEAAYLSGGVNAPRGAGGFPAVNERPIGCPPPTVAVQYVIGVVGCSPAGDDISDRELGKAAAARWRDAWAMYTGVSCCLAAWSRLTPRVPAVVGQLLPVGDEGMCAGFEMRCTVELTMLCTPCVAPDA